jgi:hypothetical protein
MTILAYISICGFVMANIDNWRQPMIIDVNHNNTRYGTGGFAPFGW